MAIQPSIRPCKSPELTFTSHRPPPGHRSLNVYTDAGRIPIIFVRPTRVKDRRIKKGPLTPICDHEVSLFTRLIQPKPLAGPN